MRLSKIASGLWSSATLLLALFVLVGCAGGESGDGETASEETGQADEPMISVDLEPAHGGRIVELSGDLDAELVVMEGGMAFVYLYDAEANPESWEGKSVNITVTTPDGQSQELELNGMGSGSGAHFMNPIEEAMVAHIFEQGSYKADVVVETESGSQTGSIDIELGG